MVRLGNVRVLDLSDERGLLAGRILADLGADVIAVEPPSGSTARQVGPFDPRLPANDRSLVWQTLGANRRGVVCDLATPDGQRWFRRLAAAADVVIESRPAAHRLAAVGLPVEQLRTSNRGLVHVSITPFGASGPKAHYVDTDLVIWAAGGPLRPNREQDRPPVRPSVPQAALHAGADAAIGALLALIARQRDGLGQDVEISAQRSAAQATLGAILAAAIGDRRPDPRTAHRADRRDRIADGVVDRSGSGASNAASKWPVRDGYVELHLAMGPAVGSFTNALFRWIGEQRAVPPAVAAIDWVRAPQDLAAGTVNAEHVATAGALVGEVLAGFTRSELLDIALERKLLIAPLMTVDDHLGDPHLAARDVWWPVRVMGADGPVELTMPGRFADASIPLFSFERRAPRLGEHTGEIDAALDGAVWTVAAPDATTAPSPPLLPPPPALDGLKVLDLSWVVAGPLVGRTLADFGATVVRVEHPTRVDTARVIGPFHDGVDHVETSACYGNANAGKYGISLDLRHPGAATVVADLVRWADVVVESFAPGVVERLGLGYDALRALNPDVIMLRTSLMGQHGPRSAFAGFGNLGAALSGFADLTGWPDLPPSGPYGPYTDYIAPRFALAALLAILHHDPSHRGGCLLDVSQLDAALPFLAPEIAASSAGLDGTARVGNRDRHHAPHGVYPVRLGAEPFGPDPDRFIAIAAGTDECWQALVEILDLEELLADERFATLASRRANGDELDHLIGSATAGRDGEELERTLQLAGVPAHLAASSADLLADPQLHAQEHFVTVAHGMLGHTVVENARPRLSRTPGRPRRAAPLRGEHNSLVLSTVLGYDSDTVAALLRGGAFGATHSGEHSLPRHEEAR